MGSVEPIRERIEPVSKQPIPISGRAVENLQFIRDAMENATHFTAVPGYGGMLMGLTAIAAAYISAQQVYLRDWLVVWIAEAFLAMAVGFLTMWQKSKISGSSLVSTPAKKFAKNFVPALFCGAVISFGLWRYEMYAMMPPVWMLCYGAAVAGGGAFSVKAVPVMGWLFIVFGTAAAALPASAANWLMAASFGMLHIIFGFLIARRHGG